MKLREKECILDGKHGQRGVVVPSSALFTCVVCVRSVYAAPSGLLRFSYNTPVPFSEDAETPPRYGHKPCRDERLLRKLM